MNRALPGSVREWMSREFGALFVTREESGIAEHMSPAFAAMLD